METINSIYKEYSEKKEDSHFSIILKKLKDAGLEGVTNGELLKVHHRFGSTIYDLRMEGFKIDIVNRGNGVVSYILKNHVPVRRVDKKRGLDIVGDGIMERNGYVSVWELMDILEKNNLHIIHKPNGLNKNTRRTI